MKDFLLCTSLDLTIVTEQVQTIKQYMLRNRIAFPRKSSTSIWMPYRTNITSQPSNWCRYEFIVLKIYLLEKICHHLRSEQQEFIYEYMQTCTNKESRQMYHKINKTRSNVLDREPQEFDTFAHYLHVWLDIHIMTCIAIEDASILPQDTNNEFWSACKFGPEYVFHEGLLPNMTHKIISELFFGNIVGNKNFSDPFHIIISRCLPQQCQMCGSMNEITRNCKKSQDMLSLSRLVLAASCLGMYRHVQCRPVFTVRLEIYRFFLLGSSAPIVQNERQVYGNITNEEAMCNNNVLAWMCQKIPGGSQYTHQEVIVNAFREYITFQLQFMPLLSNYLCTYYAWENWMQCLFDYMDVMRLHVLVDVPGTLATFSGSTPLAPLNTLFRLNSKTFYARFVESVTKYMVSGGVVAQHVDYIFSEELHLILQKIIFSYGHDPYTDMYACTNLPPLDASSDYLQQHFISQGFVPLQLFYARSDVINEFNAVKHLYDRSSSARLVDELVDVIAKTSSYQLQLFYAFALLVNDYQTIQVVPLSNIIANKQTSVMRDMLSLESTAPLSRHVMTSFVCMTCRRFCAHIVTNALIEKKKKIHYGTNRVMWARMCQDVVFAQQRQQRQNKFPDYTQLPRTSSLKEYYQRAIDVYQQRLFAPDVQASSRNLQFSITNNPDVTVSPTNQQQSMSMDNLKSIPLNNEEIVIDYEHDSDALRQSHIDLQIVGHATSDPTLQNMIWTCGTDKIKEEKRKLAKSDKDQKLIDAAETTAAKTSAKRSQIDHANRNVRTVYGYVQCRQRQLFQVDMLTFGLRLDNTLYVACCNCLAYTTLDEVTWIETIFICPKCNIKLHQQGSIENLQRKRLQCIACKKIQGNTVKYHGLEVYDDVSVGSERFKHVYICQRDLFFLKWLFLLPYIPQLSLVMRGIQGKWRGGTNHQLETVTDTINRKWHVMVFGNENTEEVESYMTAQALQAKGKKKSKTKTGANRSVNKHTALL